ncbi:MAG: tetratricopeptide repeat protein [Gemmatales bacterium]
MRSLHVNMIFTLALFTGCSNTAPRHYGAEQLNQQGVKYLTSNDLPKAHEKFVEAWKVEPQNAETLYNLASTYHRKGQTADAEKYYRQALQLKPQFEECRHNYYLLLVSENRTAEARSDAEKWLQLNKKSADAHTELGWLMRMEGNLPQAQNNLQKANYHRSAQHRSSAGNGKTLSGLPPQ